MENKLILLRGVPGSGKSTAAKLFGNVPHFEADMFFTQSDGSYKFDPSKLKDAHNWCRHKTMDAMKEGHPIVVVSNTFVNEWEMETYYLLAHDLGYQVFSMIVENRHGGKNQHGVPAQKVQSMRNNFQIKL